MCQLPQHVLEALRQPLEDGVVVVTRAAGTSRFPARFQLVGAMNPCPCASIPCECGPREARAYRKRDKILKFEGGWHGTHDYGAMSVSTRSPKAVPSPTFDSAGIPHVLGDTVLVAPYNDLPTAEALIATAAGLAAAIPAVIAYNYFVNRIRGIGTRLDLFTLEFMGLAERLVGGR